MTACSCRSATRKGTERQKSTDKALTLVALQLVQRPSAKCRLPDLDVGPFLYLPPAPERDIMATEAFVPGELEALRRVLVGEETDMEAVVGDIGGEIRGTEADLESRGMTRRSEIFSVVMDLGRDGKAKVTRVSNSVR